MRKKMSITVRGKIEEWCFEFYGDPSHVNEWREDGLDVVIIENSVPHLIASIGMSRVWCYFQELTKLR